MFLSKLLKIFEKEIYPSKINETVFVGKSFGKKAIFAKGIPQSGGEYDFMWTKVIKGIFKEGFSPKSCLMLGVAGGTAINVLRRFYPTISITGVELDPVILETSLQNNFFKKDERVKLVIDDGIKWVKKDDKKYDLIVVDLYIGDLNPSQSREKTFLIQVKKLLNKKGMVLINCHYNEKKELDYTNYRKITDSIFEIIEERFVFPKNKILLLK